jgi:hypothetical protein
MLDETKLNTGADASHTVLHVCARAWLERPCRFRVPVQRKPR